VNIINEGGIDDGEGDDEMEDDTEDLPSGPGLMNPLLMRRLSQVSRGVHGCVYVVVHAYVCGCGHSCVCGCACGHGLIMG